MIDEVAANNAIRTNNQGSPASPRFTVVVAFGVDLAFRGFLWLVCVTVP
ncbi:hypothetical protein OU415_14970 [Saccharopolyspora sp. WRP15-2]|uniref:Uncharacterized protein n=1 Tax=Saccharopolyspora oryzae TaxID=2997343 RepID=A0ABT4V0B1_9PSEU|nr:hypothetical protein [Saccharopolyspora oryzae]MDA3626747.1 hypothetical protein [Saccharopolyspora oryzae]